MRRDLSITQAVQQALRQHLGDVGVTIPPELAPRPEPATRPPEEQFRQALARQIAAMGKTESGEDQ